MSAITAVATVYRTASRSTNGIESQRSSPNSPAPSDRGAAEILAASRLATDPLNASVPRRSTTAVGLEVRREAVAWRRRSHRDDSAAAAWVAGTDHSARVWVAPHRLAAAEEDIGPVEARDHDPFQVRGFGAGLDV